MVGLGQERGGRGRRLVAFDDGLEDLDGGVRLDQSLRDRGQVMFGRVDHEPGVVGCPAAAEHGVGELSALGACERPAGIGGDPWAVWMVVA